MAFKKILFLLGSYETSKCGVSDYTYLLINGLIRKGFSCACVAINDNYIEKDDYFAYGHIQDGIYQFYRFSSSLSWQFRINQLNEIINQFQPSYLSLQYVPYAFDNKGLPLRFFFLLKDLKNVPFWHVMAHELWTMPECGFKNKLVAFCQKIITLNIFKLLQPKVLHVASSFYNDTLSHVGFSSIILPLYSNIPCKSTSSHLKVSNNIWNFVHFGNLSRDWKYQDFFRRVNGARSIYGISRCNFYLIGRSGQYGQGLWEKLANAYFDMYPSFNFATLGQLSSDQISDYLHTADFGICSTPLHLAEKSGSVAAMIAHGLPVVANSFIPEHIPSSFYLIERHPFVLIDENFEANLKSFLFIRHHHDQFSETLDQFVHDLNSACQS